MSATGNRYNLALDKIGPPHIHPSGPRALSSCYGEPKSSGPTQTGTNARGEHMDSQGTGEWTDASLAGKQSTKHTQPRPYLRFWEGSTI